MDNAVSEAIDVIESRGLTAHFYLPNSGLSRDRELWRALHTLKQAGYVVADTRGELFGWSAPAAGSNNKTERKPIRIVRRG